ncbi:hypothetical protein QEN19_001585 [Hanseniaspora menglaensis]
MIFKAAKKLYKFGLDSDSINTNQIIHLSDTENLKMQKSILILGSTGVLGRKTVQNLLHEAAKGYNFSLILINRRHYDFDTVKKADDSIIDVRLIDTNIFFSSNNVKSILNRYSCSCKIDGDLNNINLYEIIQSDSKTWVEILKIWKLKKTTTTYNFIDMLPDPTTLTTIVSCLGVTKKQALNENISQRDIDYQLNYDIILNISHERVKIILITTFNSFLLKNLFSFFNNKWKLEVDIEKNSNFRELIIIRPGPFIFHASYSDIFKYNTRDYRAMASQLIAWNVYQTYLSKFFGYSVKVTDIANTLTKHIIKVNPTDTSRVIFVKSKSISKN